MPNEAAVLPNIFPSIYYDDANAAIDWLERAFGFQRRLVIPDTEGTIRHAELSLGPGVIMVGTVRPSQNIISARSLPGVCQGICVRVDDVDAHYASAKKAGAKIAQELVDTHFGARGYSAMDIEGNHWHFSNYQPGAYW